VIVVAHPRVAANADPSTSDVLDQVELITGALAACNEPFETVAVDGGRVWEAIAPRLGIVFQPDFLDGLSVAVDYFNIKIEDLISRYGADYTINQCLATGDALFCDRVIRNASGSLWRSPDGYINNPLENLGSLETTGVDVDMTYAFQTETLGTFTTSLVGTWLDKLETQIDPNNDASAYDCVGLYGTVCGTPTPEWRHTLREQWQTPWDGVSLWLAWRYLDGVDLDATKADQYPSFSASAYRDSDAKLDSMNYFDIGGSWTFAEKYSLRAGINNVLDEDPPLVGQANCPAGFCNGNTFPQVYDSLGRYMFVGLTVDF